MKEALHSLSSQLEVHHGHMMRSLYATDASVYRQLPLAVAFPKNEKELVALVRFAKTHNQSIIPRTAGTSLAGQCVGEGVVVDLSKYWTNILELNVEERWVRVQPGVIRDELNRYLKDYGLFFSPNTSTSNRCMIGGMVGNNSSGSTSIRYGVTRDKVLALRTLWADGSFAVVKKNTLQIKSKSDDNYYQKVQHALFELLSEADVQTAIAKEYPDAKVRRRNTGYALDTLLNEPIFADEMERGNGTWNLCKLFCGSEGTLAIHTEITLRLDPLPPPLNRMAVVHFDSIEKCLQAVVPVMKHRLFACEMMDKAILDCTKDNPRQAKNRQFIHGDPKAILMLEWKADDEEDLMLQQKELISTLDQGGLSSHISILEGKDIIKAFELRKAGLGVLSNLVGDKKAVACIEDTAVSIDKLSDYIAEFTTIMKRHSQEAIYYAHAGAGELHLRPILDLKNSVDRKQFRDISEEVALLVKKYNGSLSGEHGDGRVRAEFIPLVLGEKNYMSLKRVKEIFDPQNIFNPGKIVDAKPMDEDLRYATDREEPSIDSFLNFDTEQGILRMAEKCNGSGDCRKSPQADGSMCPSYQASLDEKDTTRARANMLREVLTHSDKQHLYDSEELKKVFDLCVSCKACASECPSNVDVAILKAEFLHQYQQVHGRSWRARAFANNYKINKLLTYVKPFSNLLMASKWSSGIMKSMIGIARERSMPLLSNMNLKKELKFLAKSRKSSKKKVYLFIDEFNAMMDAYLVVKGVELLTYLGYEVHWLDNAESGRAHMSKGFLPEAKKLANKNILDFHECITAESPLVGIEPSAILSFRDEYIRLAEDQDKARQLAQNTFVIEEFLHNEMEAGNITSDQFDTKERNIKVHVHCHQKALSNSECTVKVLALPSNHHVELIKSGCCGMAGSFGYEEEHYKTSMKMGEMMLFPAIREAKDAIIVANGISCRHQIKDGVDTRAIHPIEVLHAAMIKK